MDLSVFPLGPVHTNCYLVVSGSEAMVVDVPHGCSEKVVHELVKADAKLLYMVNTHGHWDHITENALLREKTNARIACHKLDEDRLRNPSALMKPPIPVAPSRADVYLESGNTITVGGLSFAVLHTPGHTPGSICLYENNEHVVFTGDVLFSGTYGRTDFPGGDDRQMRASLQRLAALPKKTTVYPGHGEATAIGAEEWLDEL
ncbi:MAG: MBL fold metallo-hydrolase [Candidatus Aenigmarchaeota archaeon]|nr:MBL fold metallo-hydrolase [Candidatus Aenigmarchaeota archaeon]